jgi:hypothetical protein
MQIYARRSTSLTGCVSRTRDEDVQLLRLLACCERSCTSNSSVSVLYRLQAKIPHAADYLRLLYGVYTGPTCTRRDAVIIDASSLGGKHACEHRLVVALHHGTLGLDSIRPIDIRVEKRRVLADALLGAPIEID